ncbi:MAG: efflux RND transporter permease subunit [Anaerolineae bacterium]|nr:efflux RND transporter permease subunit [Anaerolineae bacterium]
MLSKLFDKITALSLRFRWITVAIAMIILAAGVYSVTQLNQELLPRVEFPQSVIVVQWGDAASAEQFLEEVTIPLEEKLQGVEGVLNVESTTNPTFAFLIARYDFGLNQERILEAINEAIADAGLPETAESQVINFSFSDLPVVIASVSSSELTLPELKALVESELKPSLEGLEPVSRVIVSGGQELPEEAEPEVAEATAVPEPTATPADPGRLPQIIVDGAASLGVEIGYAQDITVDLLRSLSDRPTAAEDVMTILTIFPTDLLVYVPADTLSYLPVEYMDTLDPALVVELDELAAEFGGVGQYTLAEATAILSGNEIAAEAPVVTPMPETETITEMAVLPTFAPVDLPETWVAGAAQLGQVISTTADITPEFMQGLVQFAPDQLTELTPEMWRALDPAVTAVALPLVEADLDLLLLRQLQAIQAAANGELPPPADLPQSWQEMAAGFGMTLTSTLSLANLPPQAFGMMSGSMPPEMMAELTPEILLGLPAFILGQLPEGMTAVLDEGMTQTISNILIADARHTALAAAEAEEGEPIAAEAEAQPTPDPARLPDLLIQGMAQAGLELEYAQDISPEMMRMLAGFGPQAIQALALLTPDNLRLLQPEVIALLPVEFLDTLDTDLRAELDTLAAEFGGAGALAAAEAEEAAAASAEAPALNGVWMEPGPNGEEPLFKTAYDLINNGFVPSAAMLLNVLPTSPNAEMAPQMMADLTPEVIVYLVENEAGFIENLQPTILELMSPETLTFMLANYPNAFDAELAARLEGIAAGTVTVFVPEAAITRTDGNPSVLIQLFKGGDDNTVDTAHAIFDELAAFEQAHPGMKATLVFEQATFIEESIAGVTREGSLGAVFAILVILVFLSGHIGRRYKLSWRATLVIAVSIPLSIFSAFFLMQWLPITVGEGMQNWANSSGSSVVTFISRLFPNSVTLNIMTLSGLTVAIGRVVDDSIVVLENSYRHIQRGEETNDAIRAATREVAIAIFSATVTTMVVFLPLGFVGGIIGSVFMPFGLTVVWALAASFMVSITVVPALTSLFINRNNIPEERETSMQRWYTPMLEWALTHRALTLLGSVIIFAGSLYLLSLLPQSFIPALGEPTINVSIELPNGTSILETNEAVAQFEEAINDITGLGSVQTTVGSAAGFEALFSQGSVTQNIASLTISVENKDELDALTKAVRAKAVSQFGEENATVSAASQTGFSGFSLTVTGDSLEDLLPVVADVKAAIGSVDLEGDGVPDIANVTSTVDDLIAGNGNGSTVYIRIDGRPAISFSGELETQNTLGVTNAAKAAIQSVSSLPAGAVVSEGFESQQQVQGFQSMLLAIAISIVLVYVVMGLTFRSFILPFVILFSLPFALVGAAIALYVTSSVMGISALIGFMMLVGIVTTNGIVLMELVQQLRARGMGTYEALVAGGRTRLRPIWMTALTAILALIPLAASAEAGAIIASDLARAVMGGLLVSTALTLIVVPVVFYLFQDLTDWIGKKLGRS